MSRRIPAPLIAALCGLTAATVVVALAVRDDSEDSAVVLDQPGEYQQPSIAVNADVSGDQLPDVQVFQLDGTPIGTSTLLDGRPLVVNLWYSTCQPCKREMPTIETAFQKYSGEVRFVGVNTLDPVDTTRSFARELGVTYELVRDPDGNLTSAAGVANFPMTFFVAADGTIVRQISGEMKADDLESAIAELMPGAMNS